MLLLNLLPLLEKMVIVRRKQLHRLVKKIPIIILKRETLKNIIITSKVMVHTKITTKQAFETITKRTGSVMDS